MPLLFYTIGFPRAGKTTFGKSLGQWLAGTHLQAEQVGRALFVEPSFSPAERIAVYQHMDYQAMMALNAGQSVLYDGTLTSLEQRHHLRQLAEACGTKAIGVWLDVPIEVARHRASLTVDHEGSRLIPSELFDQYIQVFQAPDIEELLIPVDGQWSFALQYHELRRRLHARGVVDLPRMIFG